MKMGGGRIFGGERIFKRYGTCRRY